MELTKLLDNFRSIGNILYTISEPKYKPTKVGLKNLQFTPNASQFEIKVQAGEVNQNGFDINVYLGTQVTFHFLHVGYLIYAGNLQDYQFFNIKYT